MSETTAAIEVDTQGTLVWHPELHTGLAHEHLAFLAISFRPRYQREAALRVIDKAAATLGVRSYAVWELHRKPDVLVKVWIPAGKTTVDLWKHLREAASAQVPIALDLSDDVTFVVGTTLSHYMWPRPLIDGDIEDALAVGGDYLASGTINGTLPEHLLPLLRRHVVVPVDHDPAGIKFFIWVALSELMSNARAQSTLEAELVRVVRSTPNVFATSVYVGVSASATYLISGRVKPEHYEILARELQPRIADLGAPFIATNTDSALATLFSPIDRVESLLLPNPVASDDQVSAANQDHTTPIADLLLMDESERLEFKGSAFTPLESNLGKDELASISRKVRDAVVKSCCGFLNAPNGGVLVIGVTEPDRVTSEAATKYNPRATVVGKYTVVGIDQSINNRRVLWDEFERRLRGLLTEAINPSPDPWLRIERETVGDVDVAVVTVRPAPKWFWADTSSDTEVFFVRYGNATRPLKGRQQIEHMDSQTGRSV